MAISTTRALQAMPLTCLVLLLLQNVPGVGAQKDPDFKLQQPQGPVVVIKGEILTLNCTVSAFHPIGPVKWLKGWGSSNQTIYDHKGSSPRVMRAINGSGTDFTIHIRDVRLEDAGTYYCVKFRKVIFGDELFKSGGGTEVLVHARPSKLTVSGPSRRAEPGQSVSFTCSARGFFPRDIQVTVQVTLTKDDVRSQLTCQVQHSTLAAPLRRTYALGQALRVPPSVSVVAAPPGAVEVNKTVTFSCRVQGFYPGAVNVTWLENGMGLNAGSTTQPAETPQGLFELNSTVTVQAVEEKRGSSFTCRVVHEDQEPVSSTGTMQVAVAAQWGPEGSSIEDSGARELQDELGGARCSAGCVPQATHSCLYPHRCHSPVQPRFMARPAAGQGAPRPRPLLPLQALPALMLPWTAASPRSPPSPAAPPAALGMGPACALVLPAASLHEF
ncbi:signal-regulatory protein beta-1-like isoform X2 [Lagopus leucura]|uniref:signal-regulatory protein beta-1-like isoform X2 n=1 Tax=Lagopus leucura TaxID=30410 RepID=UPI001C6665B5|nr:signal-regulatory protein beta-1-like isoform X2 [Lagopus leucura]